VDLSFDPNGGIGFDDWVRSIVRQVDGKVLIRGSFTTVDGVIRAGFARLNTDGSLDAGFSPDTGNFYGVYAIAVQSDGKALIGGDFFTVNGTSREYIARLNTDGSLDGSFNPDAGNLGFVFSIVVQPDGKVLLGGAFVAINGIPRRHIARLFGDPTLAIVSSGSNVVLSWPTNAPELTLQSALDLRGSINWMDSTNAPAMVGAQFTVTNAISASAQFYRLRGQLPPGQ